MPTDVSRLTTATSAAASVAVAGDSAVAGSASRSRSTPSKWTSPATAIVSTFGFGVGVAPPVGAGSAVGDGVEDASAVEGDEDPDGRSADGPSDVHATVAASRAAPVASAARPRRRDVMR